MRKIVPLILTAITVITAGAYVSAAENALSGKVIAYYFHGSFRCGTCTNMEKYSKEAIETNFKDALASGKLEFKAVNVEEAGNERFVKDYKLYTKALILSRVEDGKEVESKNLDRIWELARNKQKFMDCVVGEVSGFMKDVR